MSTITPAEVADLLTQVLGYVQVSPHIRPAGTRLFIEADRPETAEPGDVHLGIWDGDVQLAAVRMRVEILGRCVMSAETMRQAAIAEREEWGSEDTRRTYPKSSAIHLAVADWLDVEAYHIESLDCLAHCEPEGCERAEKALVVADAILGGAS